MKKKEVLKRLSAVSMAAMMTVTMIPSNAYAADEIFSDVDVEATADAGDEDSADVEVSDADDTSDADIEVEDAEDDSADVNVEAEEDDSEEVDVFSDGGDSAEETDAFDAGEGTPAADAVVHMTVSVAGDLATAKDGTLMADRDVTVKDIDKNGVLTYDEALIAAHDEYYNGGAIAGYATADSEQYGKYITKFWGDTSGAFGYWRNSDSCQGLSDEVKANDKLTAFVYKDKDNFSDAYTKFETTSYTSYVDNMFTLFMYKSSWNGSLDKQEFTRTPEFKLAVYDENYKLVPEEEYGLKVGSAGQSVTMRKEGTYYLVAMSTEDNLLVPTVAKAVVYTKPKFKDLKVYKTEEDYKNGGEALTLSPDFDGDVRKGYSVNVPDYLDTLYAVVTPDPDTLNNGKVTSVSFGNRWGSWTGSSITEGVAKASTNIFAGGYISLRFSQNASTDDYQVMANKYATLKTLTVDGVMNRAFNSDQNEYNAYVDGTAESVAITAEGYKSDYTITINGTEVKGGDAYNLPCSWDKDGKMNVTIEVGKDGLGSSKYNVVLEKKPVGDTPAIITQPKAEDYIVKDEASAMSVLASAKGKLTYQWYTNTTDSTEGATAIEGATEASYTPATDKIGTAYYYCVVTNSEAAENNSIKTDIVCVNVYDDPTPVATLMNPGNAMPDDGYEYTMDKGYVYEPGADPEPLKVTATTAAKGGEMSYRWYGLKNAFGDIETYYFGDNATSAAYVPSTGLGTANDTGKIYGCKVTYTFKGKEYTSWATTGEKAKNANGEEQDVVGAYVFIKVNEVPTPEITTQPVSADYQIGDEIGDLSVSAKWNGEYVFGSTVDYQWYMNDTDSKEGATPIEEGTSSKLYIEWNDLQTSDKPNVKYYYCTVTKKIQGHVSSVTSDIAKIEVRSVDGLIGNTFEGDGTKENPYKIKNVNDYKNVAKLVAKGVSFEGKYFIQEEDITLPKGWRPIGITKDGSVNIKNGANLLPFSGYLEGNNKTITVPEGGLPLLGYVKGAEVHNLNIYGKKIAGYGLVNTLAGVGLSGSAIVIDNVTLKSGSSTLNSGLIGTATTNSPYAGCSAAFTTTIRNCTIEKDVVIGYDKKQDMIGSIAGRLHGTIENCVSYATVYGENYVGGILGTRDNAMADTHVTNCKFYGNVEASGELAGGIVGGGYSHSSAPNGMKISINACEATGSVTGADKVGGILGGDLYVAQAWNNCAYTMKGNSFTGKVQATTEKTKNIGGIIGFYDSLNRIDNISNNYYAKDCGAERGIGAVKYVDTNCETHEKTVGEVYFSTEKGVNDCPTVTGCGWQVGYNRTDDPLGADATKLASTDEVKVYEESITLSGDFKKDYFLGEELDFAGMEIRVAMSDGTYKEVAPADAKIEGYNKDKRGKQVIRVTYGAATTEFTVTVLKKDAGTINVSFELLGDKKHNSDEDGDAHTLRAGNLETWIKNEEYEVDGNATVLDVISKVLTDNEYTWDNEAGNYISAITKADGTKLAQKDNGANSGWMYTLNGIHPDLAVNEQYLEDGDVIVFHYTDDYSKEHDHIWSSKWTSDADAHWHECTYQWSKCDITENAKKNGYGTHTFDEGKVTKVATCKEAGEKVYTCTVCGETKTEVLPKTTDHKYTWKVVSKATVFAPEKQQGTCSVCGAVVNRDNGKKLTATIKLNATSIKLQKKQTTKKIRVAMANGDSVRSWRSSNKKIATVNSKGVIKAGKKTGTAKITVTLKSGKKATLKVKVQTSRVRTTKISGLKKNVTLKKGRKLALRPVISPLTSQEKVTYTSSNKKVATVSKNGTITAKKKGTVKITVRSGKKSYVVKVKVK